MVASANRYSTGFVGAGGFDPAYAPESSGGAQSPNLEASVGEVGAALDLAALGDLREDLGPETFRRVLARCLEDIAERLDKLAACSPSTDEKAIRALFHQLKGLLAQFGASEAARIASEGETCEPQMIGVNLARARAAAAGARASLEAFLQSE